MLPEVSCFPVTKVLRKISLKRISLQSTGFKPVTLCSCAIKSELSIVTLLMQLGYKVYHNYRYTALVT